MAFIKKERIERIIIGESVDTKGEDNEIMEASRAFALGLEEKTGLPVIFEKEFFTSVEARRSDNKKEVDDRAAALILQRYLDKQKLLKTNN